MKYVRYAVLASLLAGPAAAQVQQPTRSWWEPYDGPRRLEFSVLGGYAFSTDWSDLVALDVADGRGGLSRQVLLRDVAVAPGRGAEAAITYWKGRYGFRIHAGISQSCLTTGSRCRNSSSPPPAQGAALSVAEVDMDVYRYGVQGVAGLTSWRNGQFFRPYLVVGAGGVAYDPDEDALPFFPGTFQTVTPATNLPPGTVLISDGTSEFLISTDELGLENVFSLTLGIGTDLRIPVGIGGLGLRVELIDQIANSPFNVRVARVGGNNRARYGDEKVFSGGVIHNLRLSAGFSLELGLAGPSDEHDPWERIRGWPADTLDAATQAEYPRNRRGRTGGNR
jgi:hypothetical protein